MEPEQTTIPPQPSPGAPSAEELRAELLDLPERPQAPPAPHPPSYEDALAIALRYVRAKNAAGTSSESSSSGPARDGP